MMTFLQFSKSLSSIPIATSWYLADLSEAIGRQELYTRQSPQRLKALREHALIESAVSSNRIEGVEVDHKRVATIIFGRSHLKDRDEEEVRGYRDALSLIHTKVAKLPVSEATIKKLHKLSRGQIWDAGLYKEKDGDIIETYADGRSRIRFRPTSAAIEGFDDEFTLVSLERVCPGVSRDMMRHILNRLSKERKIVCIGRGPGAIWRKRGNSLKRV